MSLCSIVDGSQTERETV